MDESTSGILSNRESAGLLHIMSKGFPLENIKQRLDAPFTIEQFFYIIGESKRIHAQEKSRLESNLSLQKLTQS